MILEISKREKMQTGFIIQLIRNTMMRLKHLNAELCNYLLTYNILIYNAITSYLCIRIMKRTIE